MSKWILVGAFLYAGLAAACGGGTGSGVSGSKMVVALSDSELTDLCTYLVDVAGPMRTIDCGGGFTLEVGGGTVAECKADFQATKTAAPNCAATVNDTETCIEDLADLTDAQACSPSQGLPKACEVLFACDSGA